MKQMWTPWRMAYIKGPKGEGCIFCNKIKAGVAQDRQNLVLERSERAFVMLNLYPYTNGHMMVAPYAHTGELESLDGETLKEMMLLVAKSIRALRRVSAPQGFNIGVNMGKIAGA
jgi:ATP adenylyltransferase